MSDSDENSEDINKPLNKKESLIRFGKLNKYYLIPFITPFIGVVVDCLFFFLYIKYKKKYLLGFNFIENFTMYLAHITVGLLYCISAIRSQTEKTRYEAKNEKGENKKGRKSLKLIYNSNAIKKSKLKITIIIFIISLVANFQYIREMFYKNNYEFEERLYCLFLVPILCKIILKKGIFKHQLLSLSISFLGFIIFFIPYFTGIKLEGDTIKNIIISHIFTVIEAIFYSLYLVLSKYLMHNYYLSPFLCILQIGIISFIISILGYIFLYIYESENALYAAFDLLKNIKLKYYIILFFIYIFVCIYHIFIFLVVYYFSPILSCISDIVNPLISMIVEAMMDRYYEFYLVEKSLGYILILISALIYNEIIILNFCGCNEYTSICIKERGNEELHSIRNSESDAQSEENFLENEEEKTNE